MIGLKSNNFQQIRLKGDVGLNQKIWQKFGTKRRTKPKIVFKIRKSPTKLETSLVFTAAVSLWLFSVTPKSLALNRKKDRAHFSCKQTHLLNRTPNWMNYLNDEKFFWWNFAKNLEQIMTICEKCFWKWMKPLA